MLNFFTFVILFSQILFALCSNEQHGQRTIIGGRPANPGEFPYQLSIRRSGSHYCGGTLIRSPLGNLIAISAAHCWIDYPDVSKISVMAGSVLSKDTNSPAQIVNVKKIILNKRFKELYRGSIHDIAIIFLDGTFELDRYVQTLELPYPGEEYFGNLNVSGWGTTVAGQDEYPDNLQVVSVPVIRNEECAQLYDGPYLIIESELCAGYKEGGKDACQGDSGGPAVGTRRSRKTGKRQDILFGITSWGYGCALPNYPGVYTKVSSYIYWISKVSILYELFGISL